MYSEFDGRAVQVRSKQIYDQPVFMNREFFMVRVRWGNFIGTN